ncbi:MAG: right-handed parallel beta-helix repeat-containing protein [Planctomycetaceae bacterium]
MTIKSSIDKLLSDASGWVTLLSGTGPARREQKLTAPRSEKLEARCLLSAQVLPITTEILLLEDEESVDSVESLFSAGSTMNSATSYAIDFSDESDQYGDNVFSEFEEEMMLEQPASTSYGAESGVEIIDDGTQIVAFSTTESLVSTSSNSSTAPEDIPINLNIVKLRYHVKDFGAVGDGVTDDTAAIQAALDAAAGQELYLDAGTYYVTDSLLISSDTRLIGAGANSILQFSWRDSTDGGTFYLGNRNRGNDSAGDRNIELQDFTLLGGDSGNPYGVAVNTITHGIWFRKVANVLVTGLEIRNTSGFAICNTGLINGTFAYNTIENVGRDGITSFPLIQEDDPEYGNWNLDGLLIHHNFFANVGDDAIAVHAGTSYSVNYNYPPTNITITENTIIGRITDHELAQGRGIVLTGVHHALIDSNDISNTVSTGILISSWYNLSIDPQLTNEAIRCDDIQVSNNTITGAGTSTGLPRVKFGMQVKGADRIQILNNAVRNSADRGMDIRNATELDIISNEVTGSEGNAGILLGGGANYDVTDVTIRNNTIEHWNNDGLKLFHVLRDVLEGNLITITV